MKWIKDKTFYFCKYNQAIINYKIMENTYTRELKRKMKYIGELKEEAEYYKEKYKLANKRNRKLRERIKELEE